ncbi:PPOX class F420-dependent oxidoreductase [Cryptosporangium arvum]|uniref:PPOX class F420-dependent oxidoreductase n=1 Tax=Cryptosporangium arvum TaxID=80871 RepID=UPI0004ACC35A|nr:PPOX class F420-dependent oxidoreductase [Cryptosporangium arvum]
MTAAEEIARSKHISLTTYRKDGTPVATPVWQVPHDGELWIVTEAESWKVKRIRNNPQVEVVACDVRGKIAPGAPTASGTARLLDDTGTARARKLLADRYLMSRIGNAFARLVRMRRPPMIGVVVTL